MKTDRGIIVAMSGIESGGKSTQRDLLMETFWKEDVEPITIWSCAGYTPGVGRFKRLLRRLTGRKKSRRDKIASKSGGYPRRAEDLGSRPKQLLWLTMASLDLFWIFGVKIRLKRRRGQVVICDRYLLDCLVDFRVNFPGPGLTERILGRLLTAISARPDVALCLLIPSEESDRRSRQKQRYHWESREVLQRRFDEYHSLGRDLDVHILNGLLPSDQLAYTIRGLINTSLSRRSGQVVDRFPSTPTITPVELRNTGTGEGSQNQPGAEDLSLVRQNDSETVDKTLS